jgi:hypothetical protein
MGFSYLKLNDISSSITHYKKALLLHSKKSGSNLDSIMIEKKIENLIFTKSLLNLEEVRLTRNVLDTIKANMNKSNYLYLK